MESGTPAPQNIPALGECPAGENQHGKQAEELDRIIHFLGFVEIEQHGGKERIENRRHSGESAQTRRTIAENKNEIEQSAERGQCNKQSKGLGICIGEGSEVEEGVHRRDHKGDGKKRSGKKDGQISGDGSRLPLGTKGKGEEEEEQKRAEEENKECLRQGRIGQEIAAMQQQLKRGEESIEEKRALMQKLSDLFKVKAALAKELGERIVRPR